MKCLLCIHSECSNFTEGIYYEFFSSRICDDDGNSIRFSEEPEPKPDLMFESVEVSSNSKHNICYYEEKSFYYY